MWFPDTPGAAGFAVPFVRIILHAVSRDAAACSRPCILAQVDGAAPNAQPASEEEDDREDEEDECTQLRLVPADEDARACDGSSLLCCVRVVQLTFAAFFFSAASACHLHCYVHQRRVESRRRASRRVRRAADPSLAATTAHDRSQRVADNTEGDFFYDEDEVAAGAGDDAARAAALERFDAMLSMDPGRFADEGDEEEDAFEEIQEGGDSARGHEQAKDAMQP